MNSPSPNVQVQSIEGRAQIRPLCLTDFLYKSSAIF